MEGLLDFTADVDTKLRKELNIVDAGCGSGILALSANLLGFSRISAFDIDGDSIRICHENAIMNQLEGAVSFNECGLDDGLPSGKADLLLANILANVLTDYRESLLLALRDKPGSTLVLSGILQKEAETLTNAFGSPQSHSTCNSRFLEPISVNGPQSPSSDKQIHLSDLPLGNNRRILNYAARYIRRILLHSFGNEPFVEFCGFADGTVDVTYGSTFSGSEGLFFVDSNQAGFDSSNVGVLAVGYFDSSFDVPAESKRLVDEGLDDFLANFNLLASTNFDAAASPGYYTNVGTFSEQSVGSRPYLMTLEGIGSFSEASSATAIGLFTDSHFSSLPNGGDPIGTPYDLATTISFDTVLLGWHVSASDFLMAMHTHLSNSLIFPEYGVDQVISRKIGFI